jgi:hypothetical protein
LQQKTVICLNNLKRQGLFNIPAARVFCLVFPAFVDGLGDALVSSHTGRKFGAKMYQIGGARTQPKTRRLQKELFLIFDGFISNLNFLVALLVIFHGLT